MENMLKKRIDGGGLMQERDSMSRPEERRWAPSLLLIACLVGIVGGASSVSAQSPTVPMPIPQQCGSLTTGTADDAITRDLASLNLPQPEAKVEETLRRLAETCDSRAVGVMISRLGAASKAIRLAAIAGLGRLGGSESAEALVKLLSDPTVEIRLALIPALVAFHHQEVRMQVMNSIARGNPTEIDTPEKAHVTGVAMLTLSQLVDTSYNRKAILFQFDLEKEGIPAIQPTVASTMRGLAHTRNGVRELIGVLKKHNAPIIRQWAAEWLGRLRAEEAREALQITAASDPNPGVKAAAEAALQELDRSSVP